MTGASEAGIDIDCRGMHEHRWNGLFWRCLRCGRAVDARYAEHEAARQAVALCPLAGRACRLGCHERH